MSDWLNHVSHESRSKVGAIVMIFPDPVFARIPYDPDYVPRMSVIRKVDDTGITFIDDRFRYMHVLSVERLDIENVKNTFIIKTLTCRWYCSFDGLVGCMVAVSDSDLSVRYARSNGPLCLKSVVEHLECLSPLREQ